MINIKYLNDSWGPFKLHYYMDSYKENEAMQNIALPHKKHYCRYNLNPLLGLKAPTITGIR